uniref:Uncharacterized protein n=1 Tax=Cyanistes caeruleus TaxID=156563 RepID=A0A8C0ZJV6_CYACU
MEVRTCSTMKLLLLGLSLVLCVGVAEALRCHVCKYKIPLVGCFRGANVTTCERREKCALIKTTLGALAAGFLGFPHPLLQEGSSRPWETKLLLWMSEDGETKPQGKGGWERSSSSSPQIAVPKKF